MGKVLTGISEVTQTVPDDGRPPEPTGVGDQTAHGERPQD
ncbi:hypothetical protein HMPREF9056_01499 [Actinomyces sp. oral taxon 170 str. F0386]|nr:hypothetical protein HMPREF9056_01499 [Actinomyces sp. oral taxon 170 str. F0386]